MTERPTCVTCAWQSAGMCRRFPPAMVPWPTSNQPPFVMYEPATTWPLIGPTDWCGEHQPAAPPAAGVGEEQR